MLSHPQALLFRWVGGKEYYTPIYSNSIPNIHTKSYFELYF